MKNRTNINNLEENNNNLDNNVITRQILFQKIDYQPVWVASDKQSIRFPKKFTKFRNWKHGDRWNIIGIDNEFMLMTKTTSLKSGMYAQSIKEDQDILSIFKKILGIK